jgi:glycosyltransferase involved in cell wall biosynthesis
LPRYSIIIPTTRTRLLKYSVRSALAQTIRDFEVVVSDNFATGVEDELAKFPDPRVRYVRTPTRLSINKSWEFALDHSCGEWVLLLADDDVVLPGLLAEIDSALARHPGVQAVTWRHGSFTEGTYHAKAMRGRLASPPFSGETRLLDNRETLAALFAMGGDPARFGEVKRRFPHIAQSAYSMDLVGHIKQRAGALFNPTTPDYAALVAALALSDQTLVIDKPLMVYHATSDSNSAAGSGDIATLKRVYAELTSTPFSNVPYKGYLTNRNAIMDTLLDMKKLLPEELAAYEIDPVTYFRNIYYGLSEVRRQSGPTPQIIGELRDFELVLAAQPEALRRAVSEYVESLKAGTQAAPAGRPLVFGAIVGLAREVLGGLLLRFRSLLRPLARTRLKSHGIATRAGLAGVSDILEFSQALFDVLDAPSRGGGAPAR